MSFTEEIFEDDRAALEQFIHLGHEGLHIPYVYFRLEIPDHVFVNAIEFACLPKDWRKEPPPNSTRNLGTQWLRSKLSALLQVPAVILPTGLNYIADITHPEFRDIKISNPESFTFDSRMWK